MGVRGSIDYKEVSKHFTRGRRKKWCETRKTGKNTQPKPNNPQKKTPYVIYIYTLNSDKKGLLSFVGRAENVGKLLFLISLAATIIYCQ